MSKKKFKASSKKGGLKSNTSNLVNENISLSLVVTYDKNTDQLKILSESLSKLRSELKSFEVIIAGYGQKADVENTIDNDTTLKNLRESNMLTIVDTSAGSMAGEALQKGIGLVKNEYALIVDLNELKNPFNLGNIINIKESKIKLKKVYTLIKPESKKKDNGLTNFILMQKDIAQYLASEIFIKDSWRYEYALKLRKLRITIENLGILQLTEVLQKYNIPIVKKCKFRAQFFLFWNFILPLKEHRSKPHKKYSFIKEPTIYRMVFSSLAILLFIGLPLMSLDSGISGDEYQWQYPQAEKIYKYYVTLGKDKSFANVDDGFEKYGMVFDIVTVFVVKIFNIDNIYEARHILNALTGWLAIISVGLIVYLIAGYRAGIIAMILMFLSPRFLGHSWNNSKDIPFAALYIFSIYQMVKFIIELPKPSKTTIFLLSLGIGITIASRIAGLLLIPYLVMFSGLYFLATSKRKELFVSDNLARLRKIVGYVLLVSVLGYVFCIPFWPYALMDPIKHPFEALTFFSNYHTSLRQLFDGKIIWSDSVPWNYIPKYMFISTPLIVFVGILFYLIFLPVIRFRKKYFWAFMFLFICIFPIYYVIHKNSNLYGGWRHLLFAYPGFVVIAALGFDTIINVFKNRIVRYVIIAGMLILSFFPLKFIIKNHPYEYVYFNEVYGGIKNAYGKFELDYYFHGLKEATEWVVNYVKKEEGWKRKIILASNFTSPMPYYIRNAGDSISLSYARYYERGNKNWDYAIITNTYINDNQLKRKIWPPKNTIHTIDVDGYPICAILKRENKDDYYGYTALQDNKIVEGVSYLENAIKYDPANEAALLNLSQTMLRMRNYTKAIQYANMCLKVYPNYDRALYQLGLAYMNMGDLQNALLTFDSITKINNRFYTAYYYIAAIYAYQNNIDLAIQYAQKTLEYGGNYKPAFLLMADLLKKKGLNADAERYIQAANSLP